MIWEWEANSDFPIRKTLKKQKANTASVLESYIINIKNELKKHGIKSEIYYKNKSPEKTF